MGEFEEIPKAREEDFPELFEGTFECTVCGFRFEDDCNTGDDMCEECACDEDDNNWDGAGEEYPYDDLEE